MLFLPPQLCFLAIAEHSAASGRPVSRKATPFITERLVVCLTTV